LVDGNLRKMSDQSLTTSKLSDLSKEQLVELLSGFQEMLKSPTARENFIKKSSSNNVVQKRLNSTTSVLSYYKPRYARIVQLAIDKMLVDKKDRVFRYEDFRYNTENTLYQKIYHGFLYLVDNLDPDLKYAKAKDDITVVRAKDGIRLELIEDLSEAKELSNPVETTLSKREWKTKLQDFIDNSEINQKLHIREISLTPEDIEECQLMLAGIESSFIHRISGTEIIILHVDENKKLE